MRQPLAIARLGGDAHASAMDVGERQRVTRIPAPPALGGVAGDIGGVFHRDAETSGTDLRAVAARQASLRDVVPVRVIEVVAQQFADPRGVEAPVDFRGGGGGGFARLIAQLGRGVGEFDVAQQFRAGLGADLDHELVRIRTDDFGKRQVESRFGARTGPHGRAKANVGGRRALHRDDDGVTAARLVDRVGVFALDEHAILHAGRGQFAGAHTKKSVARRGFGVREDTESAVLARGGK